MRRRRSSEPFNLANLILIVFSIILTASSALVLGACSGSDDKKEQTQDVVLETLAETTNEVSVTEEVTPEVQVVQCEGAAPVAIETLYGDYQLKDFSKTYCTGYDEPSVEMVGGITILRMKGTPYEMGIQQGTLLKEKILEGVDFINKSPLKAAVIIAQTNDLVKEAMEFSYPDVIDECQGMVDAVGGELTMDMCIVLAYGDVIIEWIESGGFGCSQFIATGEATKDGGMIHLRILDWDDLSFIVDNPTLMVRHPVGKIPYVTLGFPFNIVPYQGWNMAGIAMASNEADTPDDHALGGYGHTQMQHEILKNCDSIEEATAFLKGQKHSSAENLIISHGPSNTAAVFEMTANHMGIRSLSDDVLFATNHFEHPDMQAHDIPWEETVSTKLRYKRLTQLLLPDGADTLHGIIDLQTTLDKVARDLTNPFNGEQSKPEDFDNDSSLATNGAIQSWIFDHSTRTIYVASGSVPLVFNAYTGFTLDWLFKLTPDNSPVPAELK